MDSSQNIGSSVRQLVDYLRDKQTDIIFFFQIPDSEPFQHVIYCARFSVSGEIEHVICHIHAPK